MGPSDPPPREAAVPEVTLEAVVERLAALERQVAALTAARTPSPDVIPAAGDWLSAVGMFTDSDFMRQVDAEIQAMRAAEQRALDEEAAA